MAKTFFSLFDTLLDLINQTMYVVIGLALIGFLWGIVKTLFNADNEIAKKEGRSFMLYGIITLFVMTSFWGLVNILSDTISINDEYMGDVKNNDYNNNFDQQMI